jgi:tripartite-type tricarboxylate transporter receptor subunit TctC
VKSISAIAVALLVCAAAPSLAQDWPDRGAVRVIAPFAPGSSPDILARLIADQMSKNLKKPFIVENKAGAGGMIGTDAVAKAAPDGYTIGVSIGGPLVNNTLLYKQMAYDPFKELAPVTLAVNQPCVLVASNKFPGANVKDLIAELKANPGQYNYGSFGNGTMSHMVMVMIATQTNANLLQVPSPGAAQVLQALVAGDVFLGCIPAAGAMPQYKAGKIKVLGIAAKKRFSLIPDVPAIGEQGLTGIEANSWIGVIAPAKTPAPVLAKIHAEVVRTLKDPEVVKTLHAQYMEPVGDSPQEFAAYMKEELERWGPLIKTNNITLD